MLVLTPPLIWATLAAMSLHCGPSGPVGSKSWHFWRASDVAGIEGEYFLVTFGLRLHRAHIRAAKKEPGLRVFRVCVCRFLQGVDSLLKIALVA